MHRHVRSVGDEASLAVEQCAGKVEPLLDVDRIGGVLQRDAHLLGDRHEEMIEDLEHDRIGFGADRLAPRHGLDAGHQHMVFRRDRGAPALFDDDRLMRLDDQRRPIDLRAGAKRFTQKDIRLSPRARAKRSASRGRPQAARSMRRRASRDARLSAGFVGSVPRVAPRRRSPRPTPPRWRWPSRDRRSRSGFCGRSRTPAASPRASRAEPRWSCRSPHSAIAPGDGP